MRNEAIPDDDPALPDRWLVLSVPAPPRGEEHLLVEALRGLGSRAVEREGGRFLAYLPPPWNEGVAEATGGEARFEEAGSHQEVARVPDAVETLLREAEAVIRAATSLGRPDLDWRWESRADWARRRGADLRPRRLSDRVAVAPSGPAGEPGATGSPGSAVPPTRPTDPHDLGEGVVVLLEPGPAFGTGEHPTTRASLRLLEGLLQAEDRILDLGTGSGILAVAALLLGASEAVGVEADRLAAAMARRNGTLNGVSDRLTVVELEARADDLPGLAATHGPFHGAAANLDGEALLTLLPGLYRILEPGGWLVLSGAHRGEGKELVGRAPEVGLVLLDQVVEEGWWAGAFRREVR